MAKKSVRQRRVIDPNETKKAKFIRVVTPRIDRVIKSIEVVGYCANASYEYTPEQAAEIITALRRSVTGLESRLLHKKATTDGFTFGK